MKSFGGIVFIVGLVLAAIIALFAAQPVATWAVILLAVLGLIVGLLNITDREVQLFLVGGIAFLLSFQALSNVVEIIALGWDAVGVFFRLMNVYIAPAVAVVALKALFMLAKE